MARAHFPEQPNNRSHVANPELNKARRPMHTWLDR